MSRPVIRDFAAVVISAVLLTLPFHFSFLWPLSFIGFIPYFFSLQEKSRGRAVAQSYLLGLLFFGGVGYWLNYVNVLGFISLTLYLGVYFATFGFYAWRFINPKGSTLLLGRFPAVLCVAAFWVLLEWVRGWMLSGMPWALLGYSQWKNLPFIQIADSTGPWGVSFAVLAVNLLLYQFLRYKKSALGSLVAALCLCLVLVAYGYWRLDRLEEKDPASRSLRVSLIQGNIPQDQKWNARIRGIIFEKYKRMTQMCANESSDLIVWPETSFPGYFEDEPVMATHLRSTIRRGAVPTLVGAPTLGDLEGGLRFYNSALLFGSDGEEVKRYHKVHLVPFGEYLPFERLLGFINHFVTIGRFSPGQEKTMFTVKSRATKEYVTARFGVLICYEDIFPGLVRRVVREGADFLVNMTNDAWFGKTAAPYQHAQGSVFRAIENRVPVVRAANTGLSCFIAASGEVVGSVQDRGEEINITGHKTQAITIKKHTSVYNRFGDWFVFLCLILPLLFWRREASAGRYS